MLDSKSFYESIFWGINNGLITPTYIGYLAKSPLGPGISQGGVANHAALTEMLQRHTGWNFYICPNPTTQRGKPRINEISSVAWMVLDFDPISGPLTLHSRSSTVAWLIRNVGTPRWMISSGGGLHFYYPLDVSNLPPVDIHQRLALEVRRLAKLYSETALPYTLDVSCADISHVFRAPGSYNYKTKTPCVVAAEWSTPTYVNPNKLAVPTPAETFAIERSPESLFQIISHLPYSVRDFLLSGVRVGIRSRHSACYAAAAALRDIGVSYPLAERLVKRGALKCIPPLTDWERPFNNGYRKENLAS